MPVREPDPIRSQYKKVLRTGAEAQALVKGSQSNVFSFKLGVSKEIKSQEHQGLFGKKGKTELYFPHSL